MFTRSYLCCHLIISTESRIIGKLVHFPFWRCPICKDRALLGWLARLGSGCPKENVPNFPVYSSVGIDYTVFSSWETGDTCWLYDDDMEIALLIVDWVTAFAWGLYHNVGLLLLYWQNKVGHHWRPSQCCNILGWLGDSAARANPISPQSGIYSHSLGW